jgi:hypothetical protein
VKDSKDLQGAVLEFTREAWAAALANLDAADCKPHRTARLRPGEAVCMRRCETPAAYSCKVDAVTATALGLSIASTIGTVAAGWSNAQDLWSPLHTQSIWAP